jgi:hypothetical protein
MYILATKLNMNINDKVSHEATEQVTTFMDGNPSWKYEVPTSLDATMSTVDETNESLEQFFSRPIRIFTFNWAVGTSIFDSFDPWTLFWENKRNINRINNYNLLRCRMHVAFKINGNAFHYGRAIASYIPFQGTDPLDDMTVDRAFFIQDVVEASQRPHVYLDPTTNSGGEMVLPFFYYKNYLRIPSSEWRQMGSIKVSTIEALKHANGATDTVTVQVYAWASDVEFGVPTSINSNALTAQSLPEYEPQSGKGNSGNKKGRPKQGTKKSPPSDEYDKNAGIISKPLSTFAKIAGMLESAPVIGPYAKATQLAASSVAGVAKVFGYSRPVQIEGTGFFKDQYIGNMANTNVVDNSTKLALDIKQETTIDSRVAGLDGTDEMMIKSIAMRESFLARFTWAQSDPPDSALFAANVSPVMFDTLGAILLEHHFTPSCFVSQLFRYWHGTMELRFQFVCSKYHKGRVKIVYDPDRLDALDLNNEDNINYTQIVDLAETRDVTIKVPWGQDRHWLNTHNVSTGAGILNFRTNLPLPKVFPNAYNGQIGIFVINELTTPNSTINNDIQVNVFTRMCDDFCVMNPTGSRISNMTYFPQAQPELEELRSDDPEATFLPQSEPEMEHDADDCEQDNAPVSGESCDLDPSSSLLDPQFFDVYPGEAVESLRSLLKRFCYHTSYGPSSAASGTLRIQQATFPYYRGGPAGAIYTSTSPAGAWNYCMNTFLNYITPAFAGYRGGLRWKVINDSTSNQCPGNMTYVSRIADENALTTQFLNSWDTTNNVGPASAKVIAEGAQDRLWPSVGFRVLNGSMDGLVVNRANNGAVEAEFPWYSNLRFNPAKQQDYTTQTGFRDYWFTAASFAQGADVIQNLNFYCASAEDYNCFFFTGTPIVCEK